MASNCSINTDYYNIPPLNKYLDYDGHSNSNHPVVVAVVEHLRTADHIVEVVVVLLLVGHIAGRMVADRTVVAAVLGRAVAAVHETVAARMLASELVAVAVVEIAGHQVVQQLGPQMVAAASLPRRRRQKTAAFRTDSHIHSG